MRFYFAILLLGVVQQQCRVTQDIANQAEAGLVDYFPHVRTTVGNGLLISYTCADLGLKAIQSLQVVLDSNPQVQQLKQNNFLVGLAGVRAFALGFPNYILVLNLQTKQYQIVGADAGSIQQYALLCNPPPATSVMAAPSPAPPPPPAPASPAFAERPVVNGYPMLQAYRVYSPADEVRVEEPHGGYSGLMAMDSQYFVRLLEVTPYAGRGDGLEGILSAQVRHATVAQWQEPRAFRYRCEHRNLRAGDIEVAHYLPALPELSALYIGDHDAICDLKPLK